MSDRDMTVPENIRRFEVLLYASLLLDTLFVPFRDDTFATISEEMQGTAKLVTAAFIIIFVLLVWLAARQRRNWARWILCVAFGFSVVSLFQMLGENGMEFGTAIDTFSTALTAVGLYFSFTGDAVGWFDPAPQ
jgi:hypothetical protein